VNRDDLDWDRRGLDCEPQQARGIPRNLQLDETANMLLHVVVPVLALTDWLLVGRDQARVRWWQPVAWLAYPAAYLALALAVLNDVGRRAPYYVLDPGTVGTASVAMNIVVLGGGALALGYALLVINRAVAVVR
jgi:hypothetical protein